MKGGSKRADKLPVGSPTCVLSSMDAKSCGVEVRYGTMGYREVLRGAMRQSMPSLLVRCLPH